MSYLHLIGQFHSVLRSAGGLIKRPARGQLLFVRANKLKLLFTQLRKGVGDVRASGVLNLVAAYQFTIRE